MVVTTATTTMTMGTVRRPWMIIGGMLVLSILMETPEIANAFLPVRVTSVGLPRALLESAGGGRLHELSAVGKTKSAATTSAATTASIRSKSSTKKGARRRTKRFQWDGMIDRLRTYRDEHGHCSVAADDDADLHAWCQQMRTRVSRLDDNQKRQLEELGFPWSERDAEWQRRFQELVSFAKAHGSVRVPRRISPSLSQWVTYQRSQYRKGTMKQKRIDALDSIGFWNIRQRKRRSPKELAKLNGLSSAQQSKRRNLNEYDWDTMVKQLQSFRNEHGNCLIQKRNSQGYADLYEWCRLIRLRQTAAGMKDGLPPDKQRQLDDVGFCWNVREALWDVKLQEVYSFVNETGHAHIPFNHTTLGVWATNQRTQYRQFQNGESSTLTETRIEALDRVGFWDTYTDQESKWNQRFAELKSFHAVHNHSNVPEDYFENYQLGQWVMNQRLMYKRYRTGLATALTEERIKALESVGFVWNFRKHLWNTMIGRLRRYQEEHGNLRIALNDTANADLRFWLAGQRYAHNRTTALTPDRIEQLESIPGFVWRAYNERQEGPSDEEWHSLFDQLRDMDISMDTWMNTRYAQKDDKEFYTEEDLVDLWNAEDDEF